MDNEIFHQKNNLTLSLHGLLREEEWSTNLSILGECFYDFITKELGVPLSSDKKFSIHLECVDESRIQTINKEYREKDKVTDVLSFPQQENLRAGYYDFLAPENEIGDIIICDKVCARQAVEFKITYMEEFLHLAVHGFLHLCGFDHEISDEEEKIMENYESQILEKVKKKRASI